MSLLPDNAVPLERRTAEALQRIERVPVPIRDLMNPARCPTALLPYLAWAFSVDRWDSHWTEAAKRRAIHSSFAVHSCKGTIGALRRVVEPLGYLIEIVEWFHTEPHGIPGTFAVRVGVSEEGISEETYQELSWLIDDARPVSRHMIGLDISLETRLPAFQGVAVLDGDVLEIYPWESPDIDVHLHGFDGVFEHTLDALDIYPNG
ncbi:MULTISPECIES: phage tail protein I [Pseudomonas]|uniref:phage tail protein I n=1 Tax=Pseudomonas TaxID=286 RepID=UPI000D8BB9F1|nr:MULTISPECIES: phage tail protein I [Pseudomonas]MCP3788924.1 phage tail protein I [Pseudomonas sp. N2-11]PYB93574.1 phage tail protein I [Pseudomonas fulva]PYC16399.1 phage tail protein I [Pseudomonas fulva]